MRVGECSEVLWFSDARVLGARWDPHFWDEKYVPILDLLAGHDPRPLGEYVESITYGQVGSRILSPRGTVRYLQVVNIRDTGIDFDIKPDRVRDGSHNDPKRTRLRQRDLLLTNTSFGGMSRLIGRCAVVVEDPGKANVSQDIDVIRLEGINVFFVCAFLKTGYGQRQIDQLRHGVRSLKFSFGQVKAILIPTVPGAVQEAVEREYLRMHALHRAALDRRAAVGFRVHTKRVTDRVLDEVRRRDPEYARLEAEARACLEHLVRSVEAHLRGEAASISRWSARASSTS